MNIESTAKHIVENVESIMTAKNPADSKYSSCELAHLWFEMSSSDRNAVWQKLRENYTDLTPMKILLSPDPKEAANRYASPDISPIRTFDDSVIGLSFENSNLGDVKLHGGILPLNHIEVVQNDGQGVQNSGDVRGSMHSSEPIHPLCTVLQK